MKRIYFTTKTTATITEQWTMDVDDDFDTTNEETVIDAFFDDDNDILNAGAETTGSATKIVEWNVRPLLPRGTVESHFATHRAFTSP